ncbi:hypothetical protein, partial [Actinotalea fermentans]|uniref:hypothetical protein n=1 Tax=Actinotalea fermentans TaxID=43671 RepID=UPI0011BDF387
MRRPRILETFGAGALALAVVAAPVIGAAPISTAEAAVETVLSSTFDTADYSPWFGRGIGGTVLAQETA